MLDMCFTALLEAGLPLSQAPDFMMDHDYRDTIMHAKRPDGRWLVEHHDARLFWTVFVEQFRGSTLPSYIEAPANKMAEFLKIEYVKQCFSKRGSTVHFDAILNGGICIINLERNHLKSSQSLLGSIILSKIHAAALARQGTGNRYPFTLAIDEAYQYWNSKAVVELAAEGAKYGAGVRIFIHSPKQLDNRVRGSADELLEVIRNIACFNTKSLTAKMLVDDMFIFRGDRIKSATGRDFRSWWQPWGNVQKYTANDERQHALNELQTQHVRQLYLNTANKTYLAEIPEIINLKTFFHPQEHAYRTAMAHHFHGNTVLHAEVKRPRVILLPEGERSYWQ